MELGSTKQTCLPRNASRPVIGEPAGVMPVGLVAGLLVGAVDLGADRGDLRALVLREHVGERPELRDVDLACAHALDHGCVVGGVLELDGPAGLGLQHRDDRLVALLQTRRLLAGHRGEDQRVPVPGGAGRVGRALAARGESEQGCDGGEAAVVGTHRGCSPLGPAGAAGSALVSPRLRAVGAPGRTRGLRPGERWAALGVERVDIHHLRDEVDTLRSPAADRRGHVTRRARRRPLPVRPRVT